MLASVATDVAMNSTTVVKLDKGGLKYGKHPQTEIRIR
jgi:hypothetical protein